MLSISASVVIAVGFAGAGCPYANLPNAAAGCPHAFSKISNEVSADRQDTAKHEVIDVAADKLGIFYMNRIAPSGSQLWIAGADGSDARRLMGEQSNPFDYHASWSPDGDWIVFTRERRADGQTDLYRIRPNGSNFETLVSTSSFEDSGSLSPDGLRLAYISTEFNYTTNVFVKDLVTGDTFNVTGSYETVGDFASPHSFFRPSWSPDGAWLAFSSDVNTDWTGHSDGTGWELTQSLAV